MTLPKETDGFDGAAAYPDTTVATVPAGDAFAPATDPARSDQLLVGVVIPVRNSSRTILDCVQSILQQKYQNFRVYVVSGGEPGDDSLEPLASIADPRIVPLEWVRPSDWRGRDGNAKRASGAYEALRDGVDVVAFLDSQVFAPPEWLGRSVRLLSQSDADGVAGVSRRRPGDDSFAALYQDASLFSEWPKYDNDSWLFEDNAGRAEQLPITANLLVKADVLRKAMPLWPIDCPFGWEDFNVDRVLLQLGAALLCTSRSPVYRLHAPKLRLAKHVTAGMAAGEFFRAYPEDPFIRRRLTQASFAVSALLAFFAILVSAVFVGSPLVDVGALASAAAAAAILALLSVNAARDPRALLFPFVDFAHIGAWLFGLSSALFAPRSFRLSINRLLIRLR